MMTKEQYSLVLTVLKAKHKHKGKRDGCPLCDENMHEVIDALRVCGFAVVPYGAIQAMRRTLDTLLRGFSAQH